MAEQLRYVGKPGETVWMRCRKCNSSHPEVCYNCGGTEMQLGIVLDRKMILNIFKSLNVIEDTMSTVDMIKIINKEFGK